MIYGFSVGEIICGTWSRVGFRVWGRLITPIAHVVTLAILMINLLSPPDPPSRGTIFCHSGDFGNRNFAQLPCDYRILPKTYITIYRYKSSKVYDDCILDLSSSNPQHPKPLEQNPLTEVQLITFSAFCCT